VADICFPVVWSVVNLLKETAESIFENELRQDTNRNIFYACQTIRSHTGALQVLPPSMT